MKRPITLGGKSNGRVAGRSSGGAGNRFKFVGILVFAALVAALLLFIQMHFMLGPTDTTTAISSAQLLAETHDLLRKANQNVNSLLREGLTSSEQLLKDIHPPDFSGFHPRSTTTPRPRTVRPRIAFAITINKDGSFQDGAAVLAYSIIRRMANKSFDFSFIAFVHPNVTTSRPVLQRIGFHVIEVPTPIK